MNLREGHEVRLQVSMIDRILRMTGAKEHIEGDCWSLLVDVSN